MNARAATAVLGTVALFTLACTGAYEAEREVGEIDEVEPEVVRTEPVIETPPPVVEREERPIEVADVVSEPARFVGQTVSLVSDVDKVHGPMAFTLDDEAPLEGGVDNDLLVLATQASGIALDEGWGDQRVRVTGTVRVMNPVELEREIGWDLGTEVEAELEEGKPVLIATQVSRAIEGT